MAYNFNKDTSITTNSIEGSTKLLGVLSKLEGVSIKLGYDHYQERLHRIAKSIKSIESHALSYVSDFVLDQKSNLGLSDLNEMDLNKIASNNLNNADYVTVHNENQKEIFEIKESSDKNFLFDMNDLLKYIEHELSLSKTVDNEISSSDDEGNETEDKSKDNLSLKTDKQFRKRFFNIEMKLKQFLKQQQQFNAMKSENFQSFLDQQRLKTPMTKNSKPNPSFIRNFFEESKVEMEKIRKKRMNSIFEYKNKPSLTLNTTLQDKKSFLKSEMTKNFTPIESQGKKISKFGDDTIEEVDELKKFRKSIFKNPYAYGPDGDYLNDEPQDLLDKNDIISENSIHEEEESEYEEVEEEIEEEIEVEEEVEELDDTKEKNK